MSLLSALPRVETLARAQHLAAQGKGLRANAIGGTEVPPFFDAGKGREQAHLLKE